jgi:UDP-N-acetyl-D-mannosaminouronate:lipid I N-acetyl-D-mannosaminouronosyltransferase
MNRHYLNGVATYAFQDKEELLEYLDSQKRILIAVNTEKLLSNDPDLKSIVNENIGYPDGIGAVMALKRKGAKATKIAGAQFWLDIVGRYCGGKTFFLVGSTEDVINSTVVKLKAEYPGINIVGYRNGYLQNDDLEALKNELREKKPDIVFVAMGSPKQEFVMTELLAIHRALYMGLGGSFDLYCGKTKPVPEWWKTVFKWEGLYRCFLDIKNMQRWKRQIPVLRILYKIAFDRL